MKMDWKGVAVLAGAALVIYFMTRRDVQQIAKTVGAAIDPASTENVFYKTVSSVTPQKSLGSWLYDVLNPGK